MLLDRASLLLDVPGGTLLRDICDFLRSHDLSLTTTPLPESILVDSVANWLAVGAPGAPDPLADPADHLIAGLSATLPSGSQLRLRPCPRRAAGPDLTALFFGQEHRFGTLDRVWLRVHTRTSMAPGFPCSRERNPEQSADERRWTQALASALARPTPQQPRHAIKSTSDNPHENR
jgi:FAD/FMN-containing dehydrogenase